MLFSATTNVVVIDKSENFRLDLMGALRACELSGIQSFATVEDFLRNQKFKGINWIITALQGDMPKTGLDILKKINSNNYAGEILVSFLCDPQDLKKIKTAFTSGLLSWHERNTNKKLLVDSFKGLKDRFIYHNQDNTLVAADYLRSLINKQTEWQDLLKLEQSLVEAYFGNADLLLHLAEAQFKNGRKNDGCGTLLRAKLFDRTLETKAIKLMSHFGVEEAQKILASPSLANLGLKSCMIIDGDEDVIKNVTKVLKENKVGKVHSFTDGESAWNWLASNECPDLIIQEWKLKKGLSGPAFIQRIRNQGYTEVPIIIHSSLITKNDGPLISEMSISNLLSKPATEKDIVESIQWTFIQNTFPTTSKNVERKILRYLHRGQVENALPLIQKYRKDPNVSDGQKYSVLAEYHYRKQEFDEAKNFAIKSIKLQGKDSLMPLNILGKCLLQLGDYKHSLKILEQAQALNPQNFSRIMTIAEIKLIDNQPESALEDIHKAKDIDADNSKIQSAEIRASIGANRPEDAQKLMINSDSLGNIVSYMNNRAVALAKNDQYEKAVELYDNTLKALPVEEKRINLIVCYNLGLCHARQEKLTEAKTVLTHVAKEEEFPVHKKAASLLQRIDLHLSGKQKLSLSDKVKTKNGNNNNIDDELDDLFENLDTESFAKTLTGDDPVEPVIGKTCLIGVYR